jgi:hypothetical protein
MKKIFKIVLIIFITLFIIFAAVVILFWNEIITLSTLKIIDDYPLYSMTYQGDYGFDEFLKVGANNDGDIENFVTKRLLKGLDINLGVVGDGCTAFTAKNEQGDVIFARNFDFSYTPSLLLKTDPKEGYSSISTVNLTFAGYTKEKLPNGISFDSFLMLAAPYLPFDGMNEKGLTVALLAVPEATKPKNPEMVTLNTTTTIRLLLDKAANIEEAVELLNNYNIYFSGDINCHYLISDASGNSVIVEYYDGKVQTVTSNQNFQIATNFIAYNGLNIGEGYDEFDRYNTVEQKLKETTGILSEAEAMELLINVGVIYENTDKLQWSIVYNLNELSGQICAHRNIDNMYYFYLNNN